GGLVSTNNLWCHEFSNGRRSFKKIVRAIEPGGGRNFKEKPKGRAARCLLRGTRTNRCDRRSTSSRGQWESSRPVPTREARIGRRPDLRRKRRPRRSFCSCGYFRPLPGFLILS